MSLNLFLFVGAFVILLSFGFQRDWWSKVDLGNFCHNINSKSGESLHAVRYVCLGCKLILEEPRCLSQNKPVFRPLFTAFFRENP